MGENYSGVFFSVFHTVLVLLYLRNIDARLVLEVTHPCPRREEEARQVHEPIARSPLQGSMDGRAEVAAYVFRRYQFPDVVVERERGLANMPRSLQNLELDNSTSTLHTKDKKNNKR